MVWATSITLLGYFVGSRIPGIQKWWSQSYFIIVLITLLPTIYHALKDPKIRTRLNARFNRIISILKK